MSSWFYVIYLFSVSKNGVAARELERQLGVSKKCAWRMASKIRSLMKEDVALMGTVEVDEAFYGGQIRGRANKRKNKQIVMGFAQRGGNVKLQTIPAMEDHLMIGEIRKTVVRGSRLMTDGLRTYKKTKKAGYRHESVMHGVNEYARGDVHTNTIEGFFGWTKNALHGTHHGVSRRHLQSYLDFFAFQRNHASPFWTLMERVWPVEGDRQSVLGS